MISFFNPFLLYRNNSRLGNNNIPIGSKSYFHPNLKMNIVVNDKMDIRIFEYVMRLVFIILLFFVCDLISVKKRVLQYAQFDNILNTLIDF